MKDYKQKKDVLKKSTKGKSPKEKDNINIRFALTIEELCSDDFSFDDEINNSSNDK